jgi:hypothetical protein
MLLSALSNYLQLPKTHMMITDVLEIFNEMALTRVATLLSDCVMRNDV